MHAKPEVFRSVGVKVDKVEFLFSLVVANDDVISEGISEVETGKVVLDCDAIPYVVGEVVLLSNDEISYDGS